jgi:MSHA biogenesis protein MshM
MIRAHFGLDKNPFDTTSPELLPPQQEVFDVLRVHCQQGGLSVIVGEPGTGKSLLKRALMLHDPKRMITPVVNRTMHTYHAILRILCDAFEVEFHGRDDRSEAALITEAVRLNQQGKMLAPIIDDAHLLDTESLRKLRLLFDDFPKNANLVLIAQPELMARLTLGVNEDIKGRVTFSATMQKLAPDAVTEFIRSELDKVTLAHTTFSEDALALIARSSEGILRRVRNLCVSTLLECVRDRTKVVDLKQVNRVLMQPHWRKEQDMTPLS